MDFNFKTVSEFNDYFKDEKTCYEFLENERWPDGQPVCPHCGSAKKPYNVKPRGKFTDIPSYRCSERECDLPFTVRTGTIFEGSRVELRKWLQAAYELSISKKGISSVELGERIGVSQKTAWFINHRLRAMLADTAPELLTGIVEADETHVGGKEKNRHQSKKAKELKAGTFIPEKTMVLGLVQREGRVINKVVPSTKRADLIPILQQHIQEGSTMVTDELKAYKCLAGLGYIHESVNHSQGIYGKGIYNTNTIEGFWGLLKRGIIGTFHSVSPQHLQRYCDEFSYRYNNRKVSNAERFTATVKNFEKARLTYKELTKTRKAEPDLPF